MAFRNFLKTSRRNRDLLWGLVYAVYIIMCIGLIISSAIILKYGNDFFTDPSVNPDASPSTSTGTGNQGTTQRRDDNSSDSSTTTGASNAGGAALSLQAHIRNALVHSGVVSSIGVAAGVIAFISNLVSFAVQRWLDSQWDRRPMESVYPNKVFAAFIICIINTVVFGGCIALSYGFAHTAHTLRFYTASTAGTASTASTAATTPAYLAGASAMAGLTAFMAVVTVLTDYMKVNDAEKQKDLHTGEQQRGVGAVRNGRSAEPVEPVLEEKHVGA